MRTRRALFPSRNTLAAYRRAAAHYHKRAMSALRRERESLMHQLQRVATLLVLLPMALVAQPPMPAIPQSVLERMAASSIGKQNPYTTIVDVRVTNVVTMVYDLSYMKAIRVFPPATNGGVFTTKTNWLLMDTNVVSVLTNTSPVRPE